MHEVVVCPSTSFCTLFGCKKPFRPTNKRQRFCSGKCRAASYYLPTKLANAVRKEAEYLAELPRKNAEFASRNWHRSLGFDGRYGGPGNSCYRVEPKL
jgi:hypothetical protein